MVQTRPWDLKVLNHQINEDANDTKDCHSRSGSAPNDVQRGGKQTNLNGD